MTDKVQKIREELARLQKRAEHNFDISLTENEREYWLGESNVLTLIGKYIDTMQEEPVSEELDDAAFDYAESCKYDGGEKLLCVEHFKAGAKWKKQQDQSTIELAEDHAYFAGRTKTIEEIEEKLLSEVLPCFMHGGEADDVVAKLDEVLNHK